MFIKMEKLSSLAFNYLKRKINYITSIIILRMAKQNLMKKRINEIYEKHDADYEEENQKVEKK